MTRQIREEIDCENAKIQYIRSQAPNPIKIKDGEANALTAPTNRFGFKAGKKG